MYHVLHVYYKFPVQTVLKQTFQSGESSAEHEGGTLRIILRTSKRVQNTGQFNKRAIYIDLD